MGNTMDIDKKTAVTILVSSLLVSVLSYYFMPGADTLQSALTLGIGNAVVFLGSFWLVDEFFSS